MVRKVKKKGIKTKLWKLTSEYVRRNGADENGYQLCYTCGQSFHWKELDAGHAIPGRHNAVLFDLTIIRPQCRNCNRFLHGQQFTFGQKLNEENGEGWFEQKLIESKQPKKIYESDLEDMIEAMKQMLEEL